LHGDASAAAVVEKVWIGDALAQINFGFERRSFETSRERVTRWGILGNGEESAQRRLWARGGRRCNADDAKVKQGSPCDLLLKLYVGGGDLFARNRGKST